jgi:sulfate/thiosulfate transport system ATP-binding protein
VLGGMEMAYPDYPHEESREVQAYVRPHELELARRPHGGSSLKAEVVRVNAAGPVVKVELFSADFALPLIVALTPERHRELNLVTGDSVYVFPKRLRVFEYQI